MRSFKLLLLPDAGPPELLGLDDRTMMYEGEAKDRACPGAG
jgi:hypothetical protein